MRKYMTLLLCLMLILQTAVPVFGAGEVNVADGAAAFAYGTNAESDASMAVDGDASTAWISLNDDSSVTDDTAKVRDYLILDLGRAYSVSALEIKPSEGTAQNFVVYGANETQFADRVELTDALDSLSTDEFNRIEDILSGERYRYIIFEQEQTETSFGFNEIRVMSTDSNAAYHVGPGSVELVSYGTEEEFSKIAFSSVAAVKATSGGTHEYNNGRKKVVGMINGLAAEEINRKSTVKDNYPMVMVDLGSAKKLSHVAYQYYRKHYSEPGFDGATDFMIVASNNADCYNLGEDGSERYEIIASVEGTANHYETDADASKRYNDTGLLVFEVPEELRDEAFRYIGVLKTVQTETEKEGVVSYQTILGCSTLQAYTRPVQLRNIAINAPVFTYGYAQGTNPSLAVDNDTTTSWRAGDTSDILHDNMVIDLGSSRNVDAIDIMLADELSSKTFSVYGSDDIQNEGRTKICDVTPSKITDTASFARVFEDGISSYRYIIFDDAPDGDSMGFAEIRIMSSDGGSNMGSGSVSLISRGKNVRGSVSTEYTPDKKDGNPVNYSEVSDGDVESGMGYTKKEAGNLISVFVDLGQEMPVSHVVYQATSIEDAKTVNHRNETLTGFTIYGTNDEPSASADFVELASKSGYPHVGEKISSDLMGSDKVYDTGLWIFPLETTQSFRYIGIVKNETANEAAPTDDTMRLRVNTLDVYAKSDDLIDFVTSSGVNRIYESEEYSMESGKLSYSARVLNGADAGRLTALFGQSDSKGNFAAGYYDDDVISAPGSYADITLESEVENADSGIWSMAIIADDRSIISYVPDMSAAEKLGLYTGGNSSKYSYAQMGNSFTVSGKADCNVLGFIILEEGMSLDSFSSEDIYTHRLLTRPEGSEGSWDFALSFTMPESKPAGSYELALICDNPDSALLDKRETFTQIDVEELLGEFEDIDDEDFDLQSIMKDNLVFFGKTLTDDVSKAEDIEKAFAIAVEGLTDKDGLFDGTAHSWPTATSVTAAIKAALVVNAIDEGKNISYTISQYGDSVSTVFSGKDYKENAQDFEKLISAAKGESKIANASDFVEICNKAIALSLIAGGDIEDKEKALSQYAKELGIEGTIAESGYTELKVAGKLSGDMDTVKAEYTTGLGKVISGIIEDLKEADKNSEPKELGSSNPKGNSVSVSKGSSVSAPDSIITAPVSGPVFTDIAGYEWAHGAINSLAGKGILSGAGDDTFNPGGLLTREQAVKLLILSMNLTIEQSDNALHEDNGYTDCVHGSWYYPYVTYAKVNNLAKGIGNEEFGIGMNITRQDLAVMIYRALKSKGNLDKGNTKFADEDEISDYAAEAVKTLGSMGLITGYSDGRFGPDDNATRAEAAVLFSRFLDAIKTISEEAAQ